MLTKRWDFRSTAVYMLYILPCRGSKISVITVPALLVVYPQEVSKFMPYDGFIFTSSAYADGLSSTDHSQGRIAATGNSNNYRNNFIALGTDAKQLYSFCFVCMSLSITVVAAAVCVSNNDITGFFTRFLSCGFLLLM
jgi:hypothetical protein